MGFTRLFYDAWKRGQRLGSYWANKVSSALNRMEVLDGQGDMFIGNDGGIKLLLNPYAIVEQAGSATDIPFSLSLDDDTHWSCSAGSVYERAATLAVSAISAQEITATSWIYVAVTVSVAGSVSAGTIAAATTEPAYWTRNGSNETVINLIIGKIAVSAGVATIEHNTPGDRHLMDKAGQTVAVSHANTPTTLLAALNDSGTYNPSSDLLVKVGALVGSAPDQKIRLFVPDFAGDFEAQLSDAEYSPTLEAQISGDNIQIRMKTFKLIWNEDGKIEIADGTNYAAWLTVATMEDFECPS